ncbi:MAG: hypothetical protein E7614_07270 [Ruminococcaceae bacterium]|nr:hypothetical protein [Oscillospiraceae bacterium]
MKFLRRIGLLLLSLLFLVSCGKKEENKKELLKGYFSSDITITSEDGKLSFELENEKLTVTHPKMLKGTEIFYTGKGLTANIYGQLIDLPKSFSEIAVSILNVASRLNSGDLSDFEVKDGIIFFNDCSFEISENEIKACAGGKNFIIRKRNDKEDGKNKGRGIS